MSTNVADEKDLEKSKVETGWQSSTTLGKGDLLAQETVDDVLTAKMSIINDVGYQKHRP